ncbi:MAG: hypothetical protein RIM84_21010 [Alphaproteobacteria bacterium]
MKTSPIGLNPDEIATAFATVAGIARICGSLAELAEECRRSVDILPSDLARARKIIADAGLEDSSGRVVH